MTRGQETLDIVLAAVTAVALAAHEHEVRWARRVRASDDERARHAAMCERIARAEQGALPLVQLAERLRNRPRTASGAAQALAARLSAWARSRSRCSARCTC
jgi:hypothetical protein